MIIGSIGVFVIEDLRNNKYRNFSRLKLQTKIILVYTLILLILPTLIMRILENNISIINSLFMSASSRSTGFSVVDLKHFSFESKVILIILMFIGGSPASTSGGVKVITIAIIIATIISTLKGKEHTVIFWREIPDSAIRKALTVFTIFLIIIAISCAIFYHYNEINMLNVIFESVSAISNTGLTITNNNEVNIVGDIVLMFLMFIGRVGPLSMVLVFINENKKDKYIEYPTENVIL